jgi:hypothetical protein
VVLLIPSQLKTKDDSEWDYVLWDSRFSQQ